jgi:hypothetical protein
MADSLINLSSPRGTKVFRETAATSTVEASVFGSAIADKGATIYAIKIDATSNTAEDVYLALYTDATSDGTAVTVGTTVPKYVVKCTAGRSVEVIVPQGLTTANTDFTHAAIKQEAGTAGSTSPTGTVAITLIGS